MVALRDGRVISQGSLSSALAKDKKLSAAAAKEAEQLEKAEEEVTDPKQDTDKGNGKLVVSEEIAEGHVGWSARTETPLYSFCRLLISTPFSATALWQYGGRCWSSRFLGLLSRARVSWQSD